MKRVFKRSEIFSPYQWCDTWQISVFMFTINSLFNFTNFSVISRKSDQTQCLSLRVCGTLPPQPYMIWWCGAFAELYKRI